MCSFHSQRPQFLLYHKHARRFNFQSSLSPNTVSIITIMLKHFLGEIGIFKLICLTWVSYYFKPNFVAVLFSRSNRGERKCCFVLSSHVVQTKNENDALLRLKSMLRRVTTKERESIKEICDQGQIHEGPHS